MALSRVSAPLILTERSGRLTTALRYVVTVMCAASAGIHAALVQPYVEEAGPLVGAAFAAASLALAVAALAVRQPRHDAWAPIAAFRPGSDRSRLSVVANHGHTAAHH